MVGIHVVLFKFLMKFFQRYGNIFGCQKNILREHFCNNATLLSQVPRMKWTAVIVLLLYLQQETVTNNDYLLYVM